MLILSNSISASIYSISKQAASGRTSIFRRGVESPRHYSNEYTYAADLITLILLVRGTTSVHGDWHLPIQIWSSVAVGRPSARILLRVDLLRCLPTCTLSHNHVVLQCLLRTNHLVQPALLDRPNWRLS